MYWLGGLELSSNRRQITYLFSSTNNLTAYWLYIFYKIYLVHLGPLTRSHYFHFAWSQMIMLGVSNIWCWHDNLKSLTRCTFGGWRWSELKLSPIVFSMVMRMQHGIGLLQYASIKVSPSTRSLRSFGRQIIVLIISNGSWDDDVRFLGCITLRDI